MVNGPGGYRSNVVLNLNDIKYVPGIGSFTIVDNDKVQEKDIGNK